MGSTCSSCEGQFKTRPVPLTQLGTSDTTPLIQLGMNQLAQSHSGCGSLGTGWQNQEYHCTQAGFDWPKNGEYAFSHNGDACFACLADKGCDCQCTSHWDGTRCAVTRIAYNGEMGIGCLRRTQGLQPYTGIKSLSYQEGIDWDLYGDSTYTCPPIGDLSTCIAPVTDVCVMNSYTGTQDQWMGPGKPCYDFVAQASDDSIASPILGAAFTIYKDHSKSIDQPNNVHTQKYLGSLLDLCKMYPGACEKHLNDLCQVKYDGSPLTRQDIVKAYDTAFGNKNNQNLIAACACHLPEDQYTEYVKEGIDINSTNACDPLCKLPGAIPRTTCVGSSCSPAQCHQNVCIIDDVTIDVINSNVGDISFNLACGGCSEPGGCLCIFDNIDVLSQSSNISGINFNTNCGSCAVSDPITGMTKQVACPGAPSQAPGWFSRILAWFKSHKMMTLGLVVAVAITIFLVYRGIQGCSVSEVSPGIKELPETFLTPKQRMYLDTKDYYGD